MKACPWLFVLLSAWVACSDSPSHLPDSGAPPLTVHVTSAQAPVLFAYRDGLDARWQMVTPGTSVDVTVRQAYTVAVVCQEPDAWRTWQFAGYASMVSDTKVTTPCAAAPARHKVTGRAARAGAVTFADASAQSTVDDWSFELAVPAGTYDLIATGSGATDQRIAVRRGIAVTGDLALASPIDVDSEGVALAPVALVADAPLPAPGDESLRAVVALRTPGSPVPAQIYDGLAASAVVAPQAVLIADDVQTATLEAVKVDATGNVAVRGLRRSFRFGDAGTFTLPSGITDPVWRVDASQPSVALPQFLIDSIDLLQVVATGASSDGKSATYELDMSQTFLAATGGVAHATLDTMLPGYQATWRIDFTKAYSLSAGWSHKVAAGVEIASTSRRVDASAVSTPR
ncbi:MAG TPA: hypothetical protein VIX73_35090 [Kofleriaceae bacterium]|jgi:hypothetical protein